MNCRQSSIAVVILSLARTGVSHAADQKEFEFAVVPAGMRPPSEGDTILERTVAPGMHRVDAEVLLTTASLPPGDGPQGWMEMPTATTGWTSSMRSI